jgi:hypothetical protein
MNEACEIEGCAKVSDFRTPCCRVAVCPGHRVVHYPGPVSPMCSRKKCAFADWGQIRPGVWTLPDEGHEDVLRASGWL